VRSSYKSESGRLRLEASYNGLLAQWGTPVSEQDVDGSFGATHVVEAGSPSAPPLVLLHGVGDNSAVMWLLNAAAWSARYHCFAIDTIGGPGKSVPNARYFESFDQVEWLTETLDALSLRKADMVGVSNGAYMAYNYVVSCPGRVRRVVCIEGGMVTDPLKATVGTMKLLFPEILLPTDVNMRRILAKLSSPESTVYTDHPEIVDHIILAMRVHNRRAMFRHRVNRYDPEADTDLRERMLFLLGSHRLQDKRSFVDLLEAGGYAYRVVSRAGHGLNHEQAQIVNEAVLGFLEDASLGV